LQTKDSASHDFYILRGAGEFYFPTFKSKAIIISNF
jgi:hypothetical protein